MPEEVLLKTPDYYIPGVCNIDLVGRQKRKRHGIITAIAGAVVIIALYFFPVSPSMRYLITAFIGGVVAVQYQQVKYTFCIVNGAGGMVEKDGIHTKLDDPQAKREDQLRAFRMFIWAAVAAIPIGLLGLLPF